MYTYFPLGDSAFLIKVGHTISSHINKQVLAFVEQINKKKIAGITELIPAYNELMVCYNPLKINYNELLNKLKELEKTNKVNVHLKAAKVYIPVCYDGIFAPDLHHVAQTNSLTVKEVIKIHSSTAYPVYMLGFTPGFCYLGGMNQKIATPRKESPRREIEAGSVGIAATQTGIYPINSPGGWQIIGRTPLKLFNSEKKPEFLIKAGDYIKFEPITDTRFYEIKKDVDNGSYEPKKEKADE